MYIDDGMCKKCGTTSIVISKDLVVSSYIEYRGINHIGVIDKNTYKLINV